MTRNYEMIDVMGVKSICHMKTRYDITNYLVRMIMNNMAKQDHVITIPLLLELATKCKGGNDVHCKTANEYDEIQAVR